MIDVVAAIRESVADPEIREIGNTRIFYPRDETEASLAIVAANEQNFKIAPCGNLTRLDVDSLPDSTLLLSSERLNHMVELAGDDLFVTIGAGMTFAELNRSLASSNLCVPAPFLSYAGTVGGACSLGASFGEQGTSFHIRQIVPSIEFITPTGKTLRSGAVTIKSVAGYDIARFICGSKGMFGFITEVTFHLKPASSVHQPNTPGLNLPKTVVPKWVHSRPNDASMRSLKSSLDPARIFPTAAD